MQEEISALLPLVRRMARNVASRISGSLRPDVDDLVSAGCIGLLEAAERFESAPGRPLIAFAYRRIRGAMFDWLRSTDPRTARMRQEDAYVMTGLDGDLLIDERSNPAEEACARIDVCDVLFALEPRERAIVVWSMRDGLTLREVGTRLSVTESRACQLRTRALRKVRKSPSHLR